MSFFPILSGGAQQLGLIDPCADIGDGQDCVAWFAADRSSVAKGAASFDGSDGQSLNIHNVTGLELAFGDETFTFATWVRLDASPPARHQGIICKSTTFDVLASQANVAYNLWYNNSTSRFVWSVSNGTVALSVTASALGAPSFGTWYFIVVAHDADADTITIQVNNGGVNTTNYSGGCQPLQSAGFAIGAIDDVIGTTMKGDVEDTTVWQRTLTSAEKTYLYNAGAGRGYLDYGIEATDGESLLTDIVAMFGMNGADNGVEDTVGTIELQATNGVGTDPGFIESAAAHGDTIIRLNDLTGHGYHATPVSASNAPTLFDFGPWLLSFDGVDDYLRIPRMQGEFTDGYTIMALFVVEEGECMPFGSQDDIGGQHHTLMGLYVNPTGTLQGLISNDDNVYFVADCADLAYDEVAIAVPTVAMSRDTSIDGWNKIIKTQNTDFAPYTGIGPENAATESPYIMASNANGTPINFAGGLFAELIIYGRKLTDIEIRKVMKRYFLNKYII